MMDQKLMTSVLTGVLVIWVIYRRVRRNIGRQPLNRRRMQLRVATLAIIGAVFALNAIHDVMLIGALLLGALGGAVLGQLSLRHTKFEATTEGNFYTPHTTIGVAISALLLARLMYRFMVIYPATEAAVQANRYPLGSYQKSPLTLAIFGLVVGYYLLYYVGVLSKGRTRQAAATQL